MAGDFMICRKELAKSFERLKVTSPGISTREDTSQYVTEFNPKMLLKSRYSLCEIKNKNHFWFKTYKTFRLPRKNKKELKKVIGDIAWIKLYRERNGKQTISEALGKVSNNVAQQRSVYAPYLLADDPEVIRR